MYINPLILFTFLSFVPSYCNDLFSGMNKIERGLKQCFKVINLDKNCKAFIKIITKGISRVRMALLYCILIA